MHVKPFCLQQEPLGHSDHLTSLMFVFQIFKFKFHSLYKLDGKLRTMAANDSIADEFECPVCLLIPREVPIPACSVGHIVCKKCRENVTNCPTCRRRMPKDGTNYLANKLIEKIPHPCKYRQLGCQIKNPLKEIKEHEDRCLYKIIKCPYLNCRSEVQIRNYHHHAMNSPCNMIPDNQLKTFKSLFSQSFHGQPSTKMDWKMRAFEDQGKRFYFHMHYNPKVHAFVFYVTLAEDSNEAKKYLAKLTLKNPNDERKSISITQNVFSMESAPSDIESLLDSESAIFVSFSAMRGFILWTNEFEDGNPKYKASFEKIIEIL